MLKINKGKSCLYRINIDATVHYLFFNGNFDFQTQLIVWIKMEKRERWL